MNYGQIIGQAWQILKRTRLIWILGFIEFLPSLTRLIPNTADTLCLRDLLSLPYLFLVLFFPYAMFSAVEKVLEGNSPQFREIWAGFKSTVIKLILFDLVSIIPLALIFICSWLVQLATLNLFHINIADNYFRILLATTFGGLLFGSFISFSFYGLVLHKMGISKSFNHGTAVFGMNWFKCFVLSLILQSPFLLTNLIIWLISYFSNPAIVFQAFWQTRGSLPVYLWIGAIGVVDSLFSSTTFLIAYHKFILEYDYPTLKPAVSNT